MKIAHLSDLHFTTFFKDHNLELVEYLINYAKHQNADHFVITGDLTDNASDEDFEILRNLFKKHDLLCSDRLSLVIGNHDIFGGLQTAEDIFNFPEKCRSVNFREKVKNFYQHFSEAFDKTDYLSEENIFPYVKILDDVMFLGLNSISEYSKTKNIFASNGSIGLEQFNETIHLFEQYKNSNYKKLLLIHHHFNKIKIDKNSSSASFWQNIEKQTMKLRKKKRLLKLLNMYKIDLVLHGHYHINNEYVRKGIKFLNAGGSLKGVVPNECFVNFVKIKDDKIKTSIHKLTPFSSGEIFEINNDNVIKMTQKYGLRTLANL